MVKENEPLSYSSLITLVVFKIQNYHENRG